MNGRPSLGRTFSESNQFVHDADGGLPSWDSRRARSARKNVKRADKKVSPLTPAHPMPAHAMMHMLLPKKRLHIAHCHAGFVCRCTSHAGWPKLLGGSRSALRTLCAPEPGRGLRQLPLSAGPVRRRHGCLRRLLRPKLCAAALQHGRTPGSAPVSIPLNAWCSCSQKLESEHGRGRS